MKNKNLIIAILIVNSCFLLWPRNHYKKEAAYWENKYSTCQVNKDLRNLNNPPSILEQ